MPYACVADSIPFFQAAAGCAQRRLRGCDGLLFLRAGNDSSTFLRVPVTV